MCSWASRGRGRGDADCDGRDARPFGPEPQLAVDSVLLQPDRSEVIRDRREHDLIVGEQRREKTDFRRRYRREEVAGRQVEQVEESGVRPALADAASLAPPLPPPRSLAAGASSILVRTRGASPAPGATHSRSICPAPWRATQTLPVRSGCKPLKAGFVAGTSARVTVGRGAAWR